MIQLVVLRVPFEGIAEIVDAFYYVQEAEKCRDTFNEKYPGRGTYDIVEIQVKESFDG